MELQTTLVWNDIELDMPSTPSFVEQIHIGIPCEVTMDALEFPTPWKAPFAYYGTDFSAGLCLYKLYRRD